MKKKLLFLAGIFSVLALAGCKKEIDVNDTEEKLASASINYVNGYEFENPNPYEIFKNDKIVLLPAHREGYAFLGWYSDEDYKNEVKEITYTDEPIRLYARFVRQFKVNYVLEDGINSLNNPAYILDDGEDVILEPASKKGYYFVGWFTAHGEEVKVLSTDLIDSNNKEVTLYARFIESAFLYNEVEGGYEIVSYLGRLSSITIPSEYKGRPVVGIAPGAFVNNKDLESLTIPASIKYIGSRAFYNNINLKEISFSDDSSLIEIGEEGFDGAFINKATPYLELPKSVEILGDNAFSRSLIIVSPNPNLKGSLLYNPKIYKIEDAKLIENNDFTYIAYQDEAILLKIHNLNSNVVIPNEIEGHRVVELGKWLFRNIEIANIEFPNGLRKIDDFSFSNVVFNCDLDLLNTKLLELEGNTFYGISSNKIRNIYLPSTLNKISSGSISTDSKFRIYSYSNVINELKPNKNNIIYDLSEALLKELDGNKYIVSNELAYLVESNGKNKILGNIDGARVVGIKPYAFADIVDPLDLDLSGVPTEVLLENTFYNVKINSVIINEATKMVSNMAFNNCILPDSLFFLGTIDNPNYLLFKAPIEVQAYEFNSLNIVIINDYAFSNTKINGEFNLPETVEIIGSFAFKGVSLDSLSLANVNILRDNALAGTNIKNILINNDLAYIGSNSLASYSKVEIGENNNNDLLDILAAIGKDGYSLILNKEYTLNNDMVAYLAGFKELTLNGIVEFNICLPENNRLESFSSNTIIKIGADAFKNNKSLRSINLPKVAEIGDSAFYGTDELYYINDNDALDCVEVIGDEAFFGSRITRIRLENVVSIGANAFRECFNLRKFEVGDKLISIGNNALMNTRINDLILPNSLINLGEGLIKNNTNLFRISVPFIGSNRDNPKSLAYLYGVDNNKMIKSPMSILEITADCSLAEYFLADIRVMELDIAGAIENINDNILAGASGDKLSLGSLEAYLSIDFSRGLAFDEITSPYIPDGVIELPSNIKAIGGGVFKNNTLIRKVIIPEGVEVIGNDAFSGCTNLEEVVIKGSLLAIGDNAFNGCKDLKRVELPDSVNSLGVGAFFSTGIEEIRLGSGISEIPEKLFEHSSNLRSVEIVNATSIGRNAFAYCSSLKEIKINGSLNKIAEDAFYNTNITKVSIESIDSWCDIEFMNNYSSPLSGGASLYIDNQMVTEIVLDGRANINKYAFYNCRGVRRLDLSTVERVDEYAFSMMLDLEVVIIPENLNEFARGAFHQDDSLTEVHINNIDSWFDNTFQDFYSNPLYYADILICNGEVMSHLEIPTNIKNINENLFVNFYGLKSIRAAGRIDNIYDSAFYSCSNLKSIAFNGEVDVIGNFAFKDCNSLEEISYNNRINSIGKYAFYNCYSLEAINFDSISEVGDYAFYGCSSLKEVVFGDYLQALGDYAFMNCSGVQVVYLSKGLNTMGMAIFKGATGIVEFSAPNYISKDKNRDKRLALYFTDDMKLLLAGAKPKGLKKIEVNNGTEILDNTFEHSDFKEIILADSITYIGSYAFNECADLERVVLPSNIETIQPNTFYNCRKLDSVNLSESIVTIQDRAFYGCSKLKNVLIPNKLRYLGDGAFYGCSLINSIELPATLSTIGRQAFYGCSSLKDLVLNEGLTQIGAAAFRDCIKLDINKIPSSVTRIDENAFNGCKSLTSMDLSKSSITKIDKSVFYSCVNLINVILPSSVEEILDNAFNGCSMLTNINTPEALYVVGNRAFEDCKRLVSFDLSNIYRLGEYAFSGAVSFKSFNNIGSLGNLGSGAFKNTAITEIVIPRTIYSLPSYLFSGCKALTNVILHENIQYIGDYAFSYCTSIREINLLGDVTVGEYAFNNASLLSKIDGTKIKNISRGLFYNCYSLESFIISNSVDTIEREAFYGCEVLNLELPEGIRKIKYAAFRNCPKLNVKLPSGLEVIEDYAFYGCSSQEEAIMPDTLKALGSYAFSYNTSLAKAILNDGLLDIGNGVFANSKKLAFKEENGLSYISSKTNPYYLLYKVNNENIKDVVINDDTRVVEYQALGSVKVNSITLPFIGENYMEKGDLHFSYIFYSVPSTLRVVNITRDIDYIGENAFYNLGFIEEINYKNVNSIGTKAFYGMKSLKKLTIPKDANVNSDILMGCTGLTELTFSKGSAGYLFGGDAPKGLKRIIFTGEEITYLALNGFVGVEEIIVTDNLKELEFNDSSLEKLKLYEENGVYYLPTVDNKYYAAAKLKKDANEIVYRAETVVFASNLNDNDSNASSVRIMEGVEVIGSNMCFDLRNLTKVELPKSAIKIDDYAFLDCDSLTSIILNDGLKEIGSYSFKGCRALKEINLVDSLIKLGDGAFMNTGLTTITLPKGIDNLASELFKGSKIEKINTLAPLKVINSSALEDCLNLKSFTLTEECLIIGEAAFRGSGIEEITIPASITRIEDYAFKNCSSLRRINMHDNILEIGEGAFSGINVIELILPANLTKIGDSAFEYTRVREIDIPNRVEAIGKYAFYNSTIERLHMTDSVNELGASAFSGCSKLSDFIISNNISIIYADTFSDCRSLKGFKLPNGLIDLEPHSLPPTAVPVMADNVGYVGSIDNPYLFAMSGGAGTDYIFKEGTIIIGLQILDKGVGRIELPRSLKRIKIYVFSQSLARTIYYNGTVAEFSEVIIENQAGFYATVVCSDGKTRI